MSPWKNNDLTPAQMIMIGFFLLILSGAFFLMLPVATRDHQGASFMDALFTATSATCVTGLVVKDTFSYWSGFGQLIILLLIQIGGMGVITVTVVFSVLLKKKIGLKQRLVMQESISAPQTGGIVRLTTFILKAAFLMEGLGAMILAFRFCPKYGFFKGLWFSVFHSISAFCNAGFDLSGTDAPFSSLTAYTGDPVVNIPVLALIIAGGIGFFVWNDMVENGHHFHAWRLQTKIVLFTSAALILLPFLYFYFYEFRSGAWEDMSSIERFWAALFQSVTPRTAGFNSVDLTLLKGPSLLLLILLMLIGGSPGSTAGGFKTTTFAVLFLSVRSVFMKEENVHCFSRRISDELLRRAAAIVTMYLCMFMSFAVVICCFEPVSFTSALFECASAIGTVGLSLGITSSLGPVSRILLILLMYFGRVGGLTMLYAVHTHRQAPFRLPQENIAIG